MLLHLLSLSNRRVYNLRRAIKKVTCEVEAAHNVRWSLFSLMIQKLTFSGLAYLGIMRRRVEVLRTVKRSRLIVDHVKSVLFLANF